MCDTYGHNNKEDGFPPLPKVSGLQPYFSMRIPWVRTTSTIDLIGFQGAGRGYESFIGQGEPLSYAGHVGVSFDGGQTFYGFTPYAPDLSYDQVIYALKWQRSFPGQVNDDTRVFYRAHELAQQGLRTQVYVWRQGYSRQDVAAIRRRILQQVEDSPLRYVDYSFPQPDQVCYNCATWPATLGCEIPELTGVLGLYIPALRERGEVWQP